MNSGLYQCEVRSTGAGRGRGVFATHAMPAGTVIFREHSLVGLQHKCNRDEGPVVCERCFRFLGPLEAQMRSLLRGTGGPAAEAQCPAQLPRVDGMRHLPAPVLCGCGLRYCSAACRDASYAEYHKLLCPAAAATAAAGGASSDAMQVDEGSAHAAAEAIQAKASAWGLFEEHAVCSTHRARIAEPAEPSQACGSRPCAWTHSHEALLLFFLYPNPSPNPKPNQFGTARDQRDLPDGCQGGGARARALSGGADAAAGGRRVEPWP